MALRLAYRLGPLTHDERKHRGLKAIFEDGKPDFRYVVVGIEPGDGTDSDLVVTIEHAGIWLMQTDVPQDYEYWPREISDKYDITERIRRGTAQGNDRHRR